VIGLNSNRKKTINLFAIGIILLVAVPEIVGHSLFEKSHPANSSVVAAMNLANKIGTGKHLGPSCQLTIQDDPSGTKIARVAGLDGQYGNFTCTSP
jgi:hypothetical protein